MTWHGFALNVTTDLAYFDLIVPCGISGVTMTSVEQEVAPRSCDGTGVRASVVRGFGETFGLQPRATPLDALLSAPLSTAAP